MDKATPPPASVDKQAALVAKLRYMGKQYAAGQVARGGAPQKHYLEEAADEIEMMAWALSMNKVTPASAQENAAAQPLKAEQAKDAAEDAELLDRYGKIRGDLKASAYCVGNEYKPFHPSASHVRPEWRDGWNACYVAAIRAARAAERSA